MKKIDEMKAKLNTLKNEAQILLNENKVEEAKAKMGEVKNMTAAIEMQAELDKNEEPKVLKTPAESKDQTKENANIIRAMIKKVTGKKLTEAENSLLLPTTSATSGTNGEGYILPQDIQTIINKKIREYRSLRDVLGYVPTSALTGSVPTENFDTLTGLIDFTDGTDGTDVTDIKFTNISFSLKEKGAFIKLSNTLLALTDNNLIQYISECFAKKAIVTENTLGFAELKSGKTVKVHANWKALKKSLNKDLDPAALIGTVIVTNQTGFNYLDEITEGTDRNKGLLQPVLSDPAKKTFAGYPIIVFSDAQLPSTNATASTAEKTPFIYGNLKEAVKFIDLQGQIQFATSSEAGFMSNTTIARLIEFIDVKQFDSSDKCYIYSNVETAPKTGA